MESGGRTGRPSRWWAVTSPRNCWCQGFRVPCYDSVFLTTSTLGTLRATHCRRHMAVAAGVRGTGWKGAVWAAWLQKKGHASCAGDCVRGMELHRLEKKDEPRWTVWACCLENVVEKSISCFCHPKAMLKKSHLLPDYSSSKQWIKLVKQGSWISQPMMFLNGICC